MDSTVNSPSRRLLIRLRPCLAVFWYDLRLLWNSKLVRWWILFSLVTTLLLTLANWGQFQDAPLIAMIQFPFLVFPWFLIIIALSVSPVTGNQVESLADGILSRPIRRGEYLLSVWSSRVCLVWLVYLLSVLPACLLVLFAKRAVPKDQVTLYGLASSLAVVGLVLVLLVSLGFLAGTYLRKPLPAIVVLLFVWYPANLIMSTFDLEEFSPLSLNQALVTQLRHPWSEPKITQANKGAKPGELQMLEQQMTHFMNVFSGAPAPPRKGEFFERKVYQDFSELSRVFMGYGLPTLAAISLALGCFYRRDL